MAKRTKKVGVVGKYGTRYGASLRKTIKKMEITQHSKYMCSFCGKEGMKRDAVGRRLRPVRHQEVEGDQGALDIAHRLPSQFPFCQLSFVDGDMPINIPSRA